MSDRRESRGRKGRGGRGGRGGRSRRGPRRTQGSAPRRSRRSPGVGQPEVADALGDTLEEAIERALQVLGAREDEVDIEVVEEGKRPLFGFLGPGRPYRVRLSWQEDDTDEIEEDEPTAAVEAPERPSRPRRERRASSQTSSQQRTGKSSKASSPARQADGELEDEARALTRDLLDRMGMEATVSVRTSSDELRVDVESERDDALLIGRRGETRAALQHVVQRSLARRHGVETPVLVDVNGYWVRRAERLAEEARTLAEDAVSRGAGVETEALSAQERRIIHRTLADDDRVRTESIGEGLVKRVSVIPE